MDTYSNNNEEFDIFFDWDNLITNEHELLGVISAGNKQDKRVVQAFASVEHVSDKIGT